MGNSFLNKAWYYSFFLVAAFPLLGIKLTSISIILLTFFSLILIVKDGILSINKTNLKWALIFVSVYAAYLIACSIHPFNAAAQFILEKKMSLLIFPIIIFFVPNLITKKHLTKILLFFSLSTLVITAGTNIIVIINGLPVEYIELNDFSYSYRTYFEDISHLHPTYASLYLSFSSIILFSFFLRKETKSYLYLIGSLICALSLIPLAAKMPLIAFFIASTVFLIKQPLVLKKFKYVLLGTIVAFIFALFTVPTLKIRSNELFNSQFTLPQGEIYNSVSIRIGISKCSISIAKEHFLLGVGPGQLQEILDGCYKDFQSTAFSSIHYNTHNEYFNILLSTGLIGLTLFLLILLMMVYYAYLYHDPLFLVLLVLLMLCFLTENLLDRQGGVVFFAFFTTLFIKTTVLQKKRRLD